MKENQLKVLNKMKEVFHDVTQETSNDYDRQVNKKKGAVEIHEVYVKKWAAEYMCEQLGIPDCRSWIRLLRGEDVASGT